MSFRAQIALSCALVGCTHTLDLSDRAQSGDAGSDREAGETVPVCESDQVEAFPAGEAVWTRADLAACAKACPGADRSCRRQSCPDSEAHDACVLDSLDACLTVPGGRCREEWEQYSCCSLGCDMDDLSDDELRECIRTMCLEELDAYGACSDTALESEDPCADSAENSCILPD